MTIHLISSFAHVRKITFVIPKHKINNVNQILAMNKEHFLPTLI